MKNGLFLLATFSSVVAFADDIRLGQPSHAGSGCPIGSVAATLSGDQKTLSLLFDQYQAQAGRPTNLTFDRKNCNVTVPVHVPSGLSVSLLQVDYRGYNILPSGASSKFNVEYFFAGQRGPIASRNFTGPLNDPYFISNDLAVGSQVWSPCGQDVNLRVNTSLQVFTNGQRDQAYSSLDSADVKAAILYRLVWRTCS